MLMSLNRPEPAPMSSVAKLLAMDRTTLTAALKPLERRGLIRNEANAGDGRVRLLVLTPEGRSVLAEALPIWKAVHAEIEAGLPGNSGHTLRASLQALL